MNEICVKNIQDIDIDFLVQAEHRTRHNKFCPDRGEQF